eukprot:2509033-Pleurochrysis_carterae.AAC.1
MARSFLARLARRMVVLPREIANSRLAASYIACSQCIASASLRTVIFGVNNRICTAFWLCRRREDLETRLKQSALNQQEQQRLQRDQRLQHEQQLALLVIQKQRECELRAMHAAAANAVCDHTGATRYGGGGARKTGQVRWDTRGVMKDRDYL